MYPGQNKYARNKANSKKGIKISNQIKFEIEDLLD